jgi:hypothetical protein
MLCHPAAAFLPPECFANLPQRPRMNMPEVSDSFEWVTPWCFLFGRFASLISRFVSVFARLGNPPTAVRYSNDLRAPKRPPERPGTGFSRYFPAEEGNRGSGDSRRTRRRPEQSAVGRHGGCVALSAEQPASEERSIGVTAILSLGRRS